MPDILPVSAATSLPLVHHKAELSEEMLPEDAHALSHVHVLHQLAEVFCLVELMVLVGMTMTWVKW